MHKVWQRQFYGLIEPVKIYAPASEVSPAKYLARFDFVILKSGRIAKKDMYTSWGKESTTNLVLRTQQLADALLADNGKCLLQSVRLPDDSFGMVWGRSGKFGE